MHHFTFAPPVRFGLALAAALLLAVATSAQEPSSDDAARSGRVLERILVKVNGEILTQTDLEERQISAIRAQGVQPSTNAELYQLITEVTPEVLARAVDEMLLVQRGRELGYRLSDDQFTQFLDNMKEENGFESDEALLAALQQQEGMTLDELRRLIERQMLVGQVQQVEILNRVAITDVEARNYYDTNIDQFTAPATVTFREILIAVPEESSGLMAERRAQELAASVLERLKGGEDFAEVASAMSDSPSRSDAGLIGPFQLADLSDSVRALAEELTVGGISELIRTPQGYQILKLETRTDATAQPFEEVREAISNNVFNDRRMAEYENYLDELRASATIEWKSEELAQVYERYRENPPPPPVLR